MALTEIMVNEAILILLLVWWAFQLLIKAGEWYIESIPKPEVKKFVREMLGGLLVLAAGVLIYFAFKLKLAEI